jgi:hypothetical protein
MGRHRLGKNAGKVRHACHTASHVTPRLRRATLLTLHGIHVSGVFPSALGKAPDSALRSQLLRAHGDVG